MLSISFISLTACTYLVIIAFCSPTSHHISGNNEHDNNDENVVDNEEHQEDHQDQQDMPRVTATVPAAAAAAAAAKKPTAGAKTSGETKAKCPPLSVRTVSRIYGLGTEDKYTITEVSEGNADFYHRLYRRRRATRRGGVSMHPLKGRLPTLVEPSR